MGKEMFLCRYCVEKHNLYGKINQGVNTMKQKVANTKEIDKDIEEVISKWLTLIPYSDDAEVRVCGDCRQSRDIGGGTLIKDWHGFLEFQQKKVEELYRTKRMNAFTYYKTKAGLKAAKYL